MVSSVLFFLILFSLLITITIILSMKEERKTNHLSDNIEKNKEVENFNHSGYIKGNDYGSS